MAGRWAEGWFKYRTGAGPGGIPEVQSMWTGTSTFHIQLSPLGGQELLLGGGESLFKTLSHETGWVVGFRFKRSTGLPSLFGGLYNARNNGTILLNIEIETDGTISATVPGTSAVPLVYNGAIHSGTYYYMEVKYTLSGTTNISVTVEVRLDGVTIISGVLVTGINNLSLTSQTTTVNNHLWGTGNFTNTVYKDIYVCDLNGGFNDDFQGDVTIAALRPNLDSGVASWTPVGGGDTQHFNKVNDEITPGVGPDYDLTYLTSGTVGAQDIWDWDDIATFTGQIKFVQLSMFARKDAEGTKKFKSVVGNTGSEASSSEFSLEDNYVYHHTVFDKDPATGLAWTVAGFNAKRFGVKVTV